jgi:hypothetical protein
MTNENKGISEEGKRKNNVEEKEGSLSYRR